MIALDCLLLGCLVVVEWFVIDGLVAQLISALGVWLVGGFLFFLWVVIAVAVATMGLQSCGCAGVAGWMMQMVEDTRCGKGCGCGPGGQVAGVAAVVGMDHQHQQPAAGNKLRGLASPRRPECGIAPAQKLLAGEGPSSPRSPECGIAPVSIYWPEKAHHLLAGGGPCPGRAHGYSAQCAEERGILAGTWQAVGLVDLERGRAHTLSITHMDQCP